MSKIVFMYMHHIGLWFTSGFLGLGSIFGFFHPFPIFHPNPMPVPTPPVGVVCTADAMQCPDGSWVGRSGPNCLFICPNPPSTPAPTPQTVTKTGDIVCLPFKGDGPHILICQFGLHADDNNYYALKNAWTGVPSAEVGDRVQVRGTFISAAPSEPYNIKGTIDVQSITKISSQPQIQTVSVQLNQSVSALGVTIVPTALLEDSRCPTGVQCIWEGQVRLQASMVSGLGTSYPIFILGQPITTEAETITLVGVEPHPSAARNTISPSEYVFTFEITKR